MINVGALTDLVIEYLRDQTNQLIGDSLPPEGGGWLNGQPNTGVFVPYITVNGQGAEQRFSSLDTLDKAILSWEVRYHLHGHGGSRSQADWIAHEGRAATPGMTGLVFGENDPSGDNNAYRIIATDLKSVSPTTRNMSVDPPFWTVVDTFTFVCSRTRNAP